MTSIRESKEKVVQEIKELFDNSSSAILIDYIGLTVAEVNELRGQFREANVNYIVLKNTMVKLAVNELGINDIDEHLKGPTAVAFSAEDPTAAARVISDFIEKTSKTEIKCGVLGTTSMDAKQVVALGKVPSKEILIAQLLGVMNGPARGFVTVLSGTTRGLVTVLDHIKNQKIEQAAD